MPTTQVQQIVSVHFLSLSDVTNETRVFCSCQSNGYVSLCYFISWLTFKDTKDLSAGQVEKARNLGTHVHLNVQDSPFHFIFSKVYM